MEFSAQQNKHMHRYWQIEIFINVMGISNVPMDHVQCIKLILWSLNSFSCIVYIIITIEQ